MVDRSVQRVDSFDGQFQVEVLRTIGLFVRLDDAVRIRASNGRRNCGNGFLVTDELYTNAQERARDLYPESVQQIPVDQQSLRGITRGRVIDLYIAFASTRYLGGVVCSVREPWSRPQRAQPFLDWHLGADKHDRGHLRVP